MNKIPQGFKSYFWDVDISKIDLRRHQTYVIERLLEYGSLQAYYWLKENYTTKVIKEVLTNSLRVSEKTKNFWQVVT